ncbi:MAG: NAD(P)H-binding protein, partial [Bacteroidetes bacterium]|nr:NAD(P)H-binding protein [Bacteroidota bacterium]
MSSEKILVLGATGYIGGRLVPRLIAAGYSVRCLVRDLRKLAGRPWENVEIVEGDVLDRTSLQRAADGCSIVYYLIRAMGAGDNLPEGEDRVGAENMRIIAALVGVKRIIYLGGLGRESPALSPVLRSR